MALLEDYMKGLMGDYSLPKTPPVVPKQTTTTTKKKTASAPATARPRYNISPTSNPAPTSRSQQNADPKDRYYIPPTDTKPKTTTTKPATTPDKDAGTTTGAKTPFDKTTLGEMIKNAANKATTGTDTPGGGSPGGGGGSPGGGGGGSFGDIGSPEAGLAKFQLGNAEQRLIDRLYGAGAANQVDTSNPFGFDTDRQAIGRDMGKGLMEGGMLERALAMQQNAMAERQNYQSNNMLNAGIGNSMANIGQNGGSIGAKMSALTSSILGQSQAQAQNGTMAQQNMQNIGAKVAAGQSQAMSDAYAMANANRDKQANIEAALFTAKENSRANALMGMANVSGVMNTNRNNVGINNALNKTNVSIADKTNKLNYYTYKG